MSTRVIVIGAITSILVLGAGMIFFPVTKEEQISVRGDSRPESTALSNTPRQHPHPIPQWPAPSDDHPAETGALSLETGTPDRTSEESAPIAGNGEDPGADPAVAPPPPLEGSVAGNYVSNETPDEPRSNRDEIVATLNTHFDAEAYDNLWANATEHELMNLFYDASPEGSHLDGAACRSTFCRIEVNHTDSNAEKRFLASFAKGGQFINDDRRGLYQRVIDHNGSVRTLFFYARKGHVLPLNPRRG